MGTRRETLTEGLDTARLTTMDDEKDGSSTQGLEDMNWTNILWHTLCTYKLRGSVTCERKVHEIELKYMTCEHR